MTFDHADLRKLAQAAKQGPWFPRATDDSSFMNARYVGLDKGPGFVHDGANGMALGEVDSKRVIAITLLQEPRLADCDECDENTAFIAAANPTAVLALLDEIERLRKLHRPIEDAEFPRTTCKRCGRRDGLDAVLPNETWEQLAGDEYHGAYLCLWCMDEIAAAKGIESDAVLHFAGRSLTATFDMVGDLEAVTAQAVVEHEENAALRAEVAHWKANHAEMVEQNRVLRERTDLPAEQVQPRLAILDEVDRLKESEREYSDLNEGMAKLLTGVANALKGDPPPLNHHDWSDLPKVAATLRAEAERLRSENAVLALASQLGDAMMELVDKTATALKGKAAPGTRHDFRDLPDVAAALRAEVDRLQKEIRGMEAAAACDASTSDQFAAIAEFEEMKELKSERDQLEALAVKNIEEVGALRARVEELEGAINTATEGASEILAALEKTDHPLHDVAVAMSRDAEGRKVLDLYRVLRKPEGGL